MKIPNTLSLSNELYMIRKMSILVIHPVLVLAFRMLLIWFVDWLLVGNYFKLSPTSLHLLGNFIYSTK